MEDNERIFPDDKLVSMFRNGDSHAFEILLSRYDECIRELSERVPLIIMIA